MNSAPESSWLDAEEQQVWLAFAPLMVRLPAALDRQLQRDCGLSQYDYLVLAGLSMAPQRRMRLSELAEFTGSTLSRLSNVVNKLERQGWLRREPDPDDGRYTLGVLTATGWDKVVASAPGHVAEVRRLVFDSLTKGQQRVLREAAGRILQALDTEAGS